jgi:hypothetical protein
MRAHGREGQMGKRFAIVIGVAALGAAVIAAGASADFRSVGDPRGDTKCSHERGVHRRPCSDSKRRNADVVRARAGHEGQWLKHTIRVVGKFQEGALWINTDSHPGCEWYLWASRGGNDFRECSEQGRVTGPARFDLHPHSVEIFFSKTSIGNPQSYGWRVSTFAGGSAALAGDFVPSWAAQDIPHQLGDSGVAAAGVMALGAQTAASGVESVPPDLQLSGPKRQSPQNDSYCDRGGCNLIVRVSCGDEECTARSKGRLTTVKRDKLSPGGPLVLAPGRTPKMGPELTKWKQRRAVRKARRKGKNVQAKVTVRAKDAAGNVATAKRTIRLVEGNP